MHFIYASCWRLDDCILNPLVASAAVEKLHWRFSGKIMEFYKLYHCLYLLTIAKIDLNLFQELSCLALLQLILKWRKNTFKIQKFCFHSYFCFFFALPPLVCRDQVEPGAKNPNPWPAYLAIGKIIYSFNCLLLPYIENEQ